MTSNDGSEHWTIGTIVDSIKHFVVRNIELLARGVIVLIGVIVLLQEFHVLPELLEKLFGADRPDAIVSLELILIIFVVERLVVLEDRLVRLPIRIFRTRTEAYSALSQLLRQTRTERVDLIQFTGYAAREFLETLAKKGTAVRVRLLLQHPDEAARFDYKTKVDHPTNIVSTITHIGLLHDEYRHCGFNVELRYYRTPASMATIVVDDDPVVLGWYRYYSDSESASIHLRGHNTPAILATGLEGRDLREFAQKQFSTLWECATEQRPFEVGRDLRR